jgi:hypothetical protein
VQTREAAVQKEKVTEQVFDERAEQELPGRPRWKRSL